ncbi:ABC transporter permease [Chelativorans xinjiangense]|uniref:ABC transporter permease n=1 Tax=Chelativorans xinjiangense TaxID=2681485 RepID=UPI00135CDA27|nr:ABC transporter permease [Chelativorans xinjiangense]
MNAPSTGSGPRAIPDRLEGRWSSLFKSWETLLIAVAIVVFIVNALSSPYFLNAWNLSDATFNFTEKAMIAMAMALLIISGEIDLSVAAIIALASTAMGVALQYGAGTPELVLTGLLVGLLCGAFNGWLVTGLGLPSIVVTIGTMSLFRGIAYIILGDKAFTGYPPGFAWFGQGYVWWVISFELVLFLAIALFFGILLHWTSFGRTVYAIGNNLVGALFSGVRVGRTKFILFLMTGLMSGIAAICLTARLGSTRPSIAFGWELEVVTMVVLGGVSILGGSGGIPGVVIAAVIMGLVTFGFGLANVPGIVMSIFVGLLLITVIGAPMLWQRLKGERSA